MGDLRYDERGEAEAVLILNNNVHLLHSTSKQKDGILEERSWRSLKRRTATRL